MSPVAEEKDVFRASFDRFAAALSPADPPWLRSLRTGAMARFTERGFPSTRDEAWRHTSVAPLARTIFRTAEPALDTNRIEAALSGLRLPGAGGNEIVFVNGRLAPMFSRVAGDVEVMGLRRALDRLESHLGRVQGEAGPLALLNTAFIDDGACIWIPEGRHVDGVVHVIYLSTNPAGAPIVSHPRTVVVAKSGSQAQIVESYGGANGEVYWANAVTEIAIEDGAVLDHVTLQQQGLAAFHTATTAARLGRDARFSTHAVTLGASLSRHDVTATFAAPGGDCVMNGLFVGSGTQHMDTHTRVDHAQPHTGSRELYKGILDGRSRGVFDGRIVVRKDAQKTDAQQTNKNLLLSKEALVHSTPALEILADDVKCKHGSTTGQLDPTAVFYLRSRGIGEAEARALLTFAFASDVIQKVPVTAIRERLTERLQSQLGKEARA
ncbi:MAG: Fe-S cluster assembly protein SufD [Vicinamibacteria bacterium]